MAAKGATRSERVNEENSIDNVTVTQDEMKKLLKDLKPNKSPGTDEIHPLFLKECATIVRSPHFV